MSSIKERRGYSPEVPQLIRPLEVWGHTKNIAVIVEVEQFGRKSKAIYYPEKGVRFTIDTRIPKPYEVRHHIAYSLLCELLGWDVAISAIPFYLDPNDHGALSPLYEPVEVKPHYHFENLHPNETWLKIAALDYLAGLVDRTSNDVLFLPNGEVKVTDNGLSFVEGTDFTTQISVIRKALRGRGLPNDILADLASIQPEQLEELSPFLFNADAALDSVLQRQTALLEAAIVL